MSTDPSDHSAPIMLQIGVLTGRVESILTAMAVWQSSAQARDERVEVLERRLNTIEGSLATKDDLKGLAKEVAALAAAMAESKGRGQAIGGISTQAAAWAAVAMAGAGAIVALLALVNSGRNTRDLLHQERRSLPPPAIHQLR